MDEDDEEGRWDDTSLWDSLSELHSVAFLIIQLPPGCPLEQVATDSNAAFPTHPFLQHFNKQSLFPLCLCRTLPESPFSAGNYFQSSGSRMQSGRLCSCSFEIRLCLVDQSVFSWWYCSLVFTIRSMFSPRQLIGLQLLVLCLCLPVFRTGMTVASFQLLGNLLVFQDWLQMSRSLCLT